MKWDGAVRGADSIFFIPRVDDWLFDTFEFNMLEAALYKIILQKHFCVWTWQYLAKVLRTSRATVGRTLKRMAEIGIIEQYRIQLEGNKTRTVNIALVDKDGVIPEETINSYRKAGYARIMQNEHD